MARRTKKPEPKSQSPDDAWLEHVEIECAKAAVRWLKAGVNTKRPICSLNMGELRALCAAVTAHWIVLASRRIKEAPDTDEAAYYADLLM